MPAGLQSRPWGSPGPFAYRCDCRERRLRYRRACAAGRIARHAAEAIEVPGVAEPAVEPTGLYPGEPWHAGGDAVHRLARGRRRPCLCRARIAAGPADLEMTNQELHNLARELNSRGE